MAEHVLLAGMGRFGSILAESLAKQGYDVLAVDRRDEPLRAVADRVSKVVRGDATSIALWNDLPVRGATIAIVAFSSNVESNVLTALLFRKLGVKHIIAKSEGPLHTELLQAIGVQAVIEPTKESAERVAHTLGTAMADYVKVTEDFGIAKVVGRRLLIGLTMRTLFKDYNVTPLLICRRDKVMPVPADEERVQRGDILILAGRDRDLRGLPDVGDEGDARAPAQGEPRQPGD